MGLCTKGKALGRGPLSSRGDLVTFWSRSQKTGSKGTFLPATTPSTGVKTLWDLAS